jgi:tRNA (adenine37-N6)-methyltransferase
MTDSVEGARANLEPVTFRPIGIIRTPFEWTEGMPVQAVAAAGARGRIELDPAFVEGLADLDGFSHVILLYHLHRISEPRLTVTPFLDDRPHGIFATRSPARPDPIGLSTVRLVGIADATIEIEDVDMVDGTPLLDIKPYVPGLDDRPGARSGWYTDRLDRLPTTRADNRFR